MKRVVLELSEPLFEEIERAALNLRMTASQFIKKAAEAALPPQVPAEPNWTFPAPQDLGAVLADPEDWWLLANEGESRTALRSASAHPHASEP